MRHKQDSTIYVRRDHRCYMQSLTYANGEGRKELSSFGEITLTNFFQRYSEQLK